MLNSLSDLTTQVVVSYFLIFCRIGEAYMTMPSLGEAYISTRIRLIAAIITSIVIVPVVDNAFKGVHENVMIMTLRIFNEVLIGVIMGFLVKVLMATIGLCGIMISSQSGLSSAMMFDPNTDSQGVVEGNFLSAVVVVLIFVTDMHHHLLYGIVHSYKVFPLLHTINYEHLANDISHLIGQSFIMAFKMASPHIVVGIILMFSAGILSRLMPNIQIFFLLMPIQILVSFTLMTLTLGSIIMWYFEFLSENINKMFGL